MRKVLLSAVTISLLFSNPAPAFSTDLSTTHQATRLNDVSPQGIVWGETVRVFNSEQECNFEANRRNYWDDDLWYYCEKQPSGAWDLKRRQGFFGA